MFTQINNEKIRLNFQSGIKVYVDGPETYYLVEVNEFKKNSVILNVVSDYHMWFEPLLKNNKHLINVNPNFNNLYDIIIELKNNDKKAEQIANNGLLFSNKYINQDSLCTYWFFYMFYSNKYYKH